MPWIVALGFCKWEIDDALPHTIVIMPSPRAAALAANCTPAADQLSERGSPGGHSEGSLRQRGPSGRARHPRYASISSDHA